MKKLLLVLAVASFAVACNNSGEKKATDDSTATKVDSPAVTAPDTASHMSGDTTTTAKPDSTTK
jgi:hypothetical protein